MPATCGIFWMKGLIAKLERRTFSTIAALPHWRMPLFTSRREQAVTFLHVSNDCESSVKNLQLPPGHLFTPFEASIVCVIVISAHVSSECVPALPPPSESSRQAALLPSFHSSSCGRLRPGLPDFASLLRLEPETQSYLRSPRRTCPPAVHMHQYSRQFPSQRCRHLDEIGSQSAVQH